MENYFTHHTDELKVPKQLVLMKVWTMHIVTYYLVGLETQILEGQ
jgi:hypothetical protein